MIIVVTPYEVLNYQHHQRLLLIEPYIDGVILRSPTDRKSLKGWIESLIYKGFPKRKIIMHSDVECAEALNIRRIHFREYEWPSELNVEVWEVSMSVHSESAIEYAKLQGAKFGLYGHLFMTQSKPNQLPRTADEIAQALNRDLPLVAIGGINSTTIAEVSPKFSGIAMIDSAFHQKRQSFDAIVKQWRSKGGD